MERKTVKRWQCYSKVLFTFLGNTETNNRQPRLPVSISTWIDFTHTNCGLTNLTKSLQHINLSWYQFIFDEFNQNSMVLWVIWCRQSDFEQLASRVRSMFIQFVTMMGEFECNQSFSSQTHCSHYRVVHIVSRW